MNLSHPENLQIKNPDGTAATGGSQEWYPTRSQRASGCGPTAASNIIWYMTLSRAAPQTLCDTGNGEKERFVELMREMFGYVKPGMGGVNTSAIFADGVVRYASARGETLTPHKLEIPRARRKRPDIASVGDFILAGLQNDSPVAFLNLSNGKLAKPDSWHWVTIIKYDPDSASAGIIDQGSEHDVPLKTWLDTTLLGGALVYLL